jgi:hypothetical protein
MGHGMWFSLFPFGSIVYLRRIMRAVQRIYIHVMVLLCSPVCLISAPAVASDNGHCAVCHSAGGLMLGLALMEGQIGFGASSRCQMSGRCEQVRVMFGC